MTHITEAQRIVDNFGDDFDEMMFEVIHEAAFVDASLEDEVKYQFGDGSAVILHGGEFFIEPMLLGVE